MIYGQQKRAMDAQEKYCDEKNLPFFVPLFGECYHCHRQIFGEGGISEKKAGEELITSCPFCRTSFCD